MKVEEMREAIREHLLTSYVMRSAAEHALTQLEDVCSEAAERGWNGYDAMPVNPLACGYAKFFLNALPTTAPIPEVSADPDGEVALDWSFGERKALSVSIGQSGRCTFAWIKGQNTNRGTAWIDDEIPAEIAFALGQLAREKVAR
jgi:hypothetical protein